MTADVIEKIRVGDHLTDEELDEAIAFYGQMESGLRLLGPTFHLAWAEVQRVLYQLQSYRHNRDSYGT
jgi:hypothetical protein